MKRKAWVFVKRPTCGLMRGHLHGTHAAVEAFAHPDHDLLDVVAALIVPVPVVDVRDPHLDVNERSRIAA